MIQIKWIDGIKFIPGMGTVKTDDIINIDELTGNLFIKQGQAKKVKSPKNIKEV